MFVVQPQDPHQQHPIGAAIDKRRKELGLRWKDVYEQSGLSQETVRQIRNGNKPAVRTTDSEPRLEAVLRWRRGSIQAIREHGEPTPLPDDADSPAPAPPADYPDWVGDEAFFRYIYDYPGPDAGLSDKRIAVRSVRFAREDAQAYRERGA